MALYTETIFAKNQANTGNLSLMPDQLGEISNVVASHSLIGLLGTELPVETATKSVVTFMRNIGQAFKEKTKAGLGEVDAPKLEPVVLKWNKPKYQALGFTAADEILGLPKAAGIKMDRALSDFLDDFEATSWAALEAKATSLASQKTAVDLTKKTGKEIYKILVDEALKVQNLKSEKEGINRIQKNKIVIFVKPEIFNILASELIIGNFAKEAVLDGTTAINTIGGYKIVENPYLTTMDAIVATTFTAGSMININASNIAQLQPTNDTGLYFEAMSLFGLAYESCIRFIAKS